MITPRRYWLTVAMLLTAWLLTAWGWREAWIHARYEARLQQFRLEEEQLRSAHAADQVDALMERLGLPKWWKNWTPKPSEGRR